MGLFDFFKSSSNKKPESLSEPKSQIIDSYEKLNQETDRIRAENKLWQNDYNKIIELSNKASYFEKLGQIQEAIELYHKAVDFGEKSEKLSINNYAHDIERVIILYGKIKDKNNQIAFLQRVIETYPEYRNVKKWLVRLTKLIGHGEPEKDLKPSHITKPVAGNPTIGKQFENFKKSLPEFNFYFDLPEEMQTFEYLRLYQIIPTNQAKDLKNFMDSFDIILSKAKIAENEGDFKTAIEAYEKLIVEEYEGIQPYERLMIIYKKLKWKEEEIDILNRAISFFENLKEKQKNNVLSLAEKYGMESKAIEYTNANKKIQYFGGVFDLYSPNPIIEKWKSDLKKYEC